MGRPLGDDRASRHTAVARLRRHDALARDSVMPELRVPAERLLGFAGDILAAAGADEASAEATCHAMLHASFHGVESHGIRLLPFYAESVRTGLANGRPDIRIAQKRRAAVLVDPDGGLGYLPTYRAMDEACAL